MDIKELKPTSIWHDFDAITGFPALRKRRNVFVEFLLNFAKEQNLEVKVDKTGNVVITKEATPGCEASSYGKYCKLAWIWCVRKTEM